MPTPKIADRQQACLELIGEESGLLFLDGYGAAIIGVSERDGHSLVVYDEHEILRILRKRDGMPRDDAEEFFDFNIASAWMGEQTPIILRRIGR